jgi:hypothetical protein
MFLLFEFYTIMQAMEYSHQHWSTVAVGPFFPVDVSVKDGHLLSLAWAPVAVALKV